MKRLRLVHGAVAASALLAAPFAVPPREGAAQQLETVRVGFTNDDDITPLVWAQKSGIFKREGLDVQLNRGASGGAVTTAVIGGAYDVGKSSLIGLINAHLRGVPLTVIAPGVQFTTKTPYSWILVSKDSTVASGKDLNGKTVACASLKDITALGISSWVDQTGGDSKTLQFVEVPMATAAAALEQHRVAAAVLSEPYLDAAIAKGTARQLAPAYAGIGSKFLITAWFATSDWTTKHPDAAKRFARAIMEAAAYTDTHTTVTAPMMAEFTGTPPEIYAKLTQRAFVPTSLGAADIQPVIDGAAKYGYIARSFSAEELVLK
jgi:NitT/TauT family transport system substrate-binding protein